MGEEPWSRSTVENSVPESLLPVYQYVWSLRYIDAPVLRDKNTHSDSTYDDRIYYLDESSRTYVRYCRSSAVHSAMTP